MSDLSVLAMIVLIDNVGFASGFLAASDYAEYLLPHSHVIRCYGPYYRSSAILPTSSLSHHSRTTWGGSMLKRRFVGRGMHIGISSPGLQHAYHYFSNSGNPGITTAKNR
jgi:hypothetical protein